MSVDRTSQTRHTGQSILEENHPVSLHFFKEMALGSIVKDKLQPKKTPQHNLPHNAVLQFQMDTT